MKVTLNWLRELVAIELHTAALCERLTMGGLEIESVEELGASIRGVLVGEITSTRAHPSAPHLTLCEVRTGQEPPALVVCGAPNAKAGERVAWAPPGTLLPGNRRIESAEIRGVSSHGMLCGEAELGLSADMSGILTLPPDAPLGARLSAYLQIEDTVLDISVTPNRGDCLSILGIAREIAALTGQRMLRRRRLLRERGAPTSDAVRVRIEDPTGCGRYGARLVRSVQVAPSPAWVRHRLEAVGIRSINNIVDVTNYVMIELGQPLHAFDYDRLPRPEIVVRRAGSTGSIRTLDGMVHDLSSDDLLITTGEEPVAVAGVMGGAESQITDASSAVLLEAAWFDGGSVRRTARRLALHSESSYRFERGVDVAGVPAALDRAAELLQQLAGGQVAPGIVDVYPVARPAAPVHVRLKRVQDVLGIPIGRSEVSHAMRALGATVSPGPRATLAVSPPSYRTDLGREIDVIEEIARVVGYDRIPATMPLATAEAGTLPERMRWIQELGRLLASCGLYEAVNLSFASARMNEIFAGIGASGSPVGVLNPLSQDDAQLRRSLLPGLVRAWQLNRSQGTSRIAAFEIGKVFWRAGGVREAWRLGGLLAGSVPVQELGPGRAVEFADAKGILELLLERLHIGESARWVPERGRAAFHPGKCAAVLVGDRLAGILAALHPDVEAELGVDGPHWLFELDLEALLTYVPARRFFEALPRFPAVVRDVAVVADEGFASDRVIHFLREKRHQLVEDIVLFDQYSGAPIPAGKKSLAYSISYRAPDRTLTDDEVNRVHDELVAAMSRELPVELRR